ncbi:hypothetical protein SAMN05192560_0173 [Methylobacillus rhizosphaerae]|uniref:Uncharacterized protein n=1 Tax=Methylobacillus rhizosphaerae TaxID=551994 RepID=A0A238XU22_9PROT|nr:hypothetical protein SAMN05192560_0173 [Methylobacillus rhizosphaerae]
MQVPGVTIAPGLKSYDEAKLGLWYLLPIKITVTRNISGLQVDR